MIEKGKKQMTPDEEVKIEKKVKTAAVASWLIAIPIGLIIAAAIVMAFWASGVTQVRIGFIIYPIFFVAVAVSSFLISRIYRKHMEAKLGRKLKNEYELTSLSSWMEVSKRDEKEK